MKFIEVTDLGGEQVQVDVDGFRSREHAATVLALVIDAIARGFSTDRDDILSRISAVEDRAKDHPKLNA